MKKTIITTGNFNLDEIRYREYPEGTEHPRKYKDHWVTCEIGGNAGNVSAELALMGWNVYPVAMFDESKQGHWCMEDLALYGCNTRFVSCSPKGGTFIFQGTHNKLSREGILRMAVRTCGPTSMFAKRHNLTVREEAPALLASLDFVPDVFFFGSPEAGHRYLAQGLRDRGSLIYYEIQNRIEMNKALRDSLDVAHIIKMSDEHVTLAQADEFVRTYPHKLFIQSMGAQGVRFSLHGQKWITVPAVPAKVMDTEGAGDAMTAAFINALPVLDVARLTTDQVRTALETAQQVSAQAISYQGAKGHILNDSKYAHIAAAVQRRIKKL